MPGKKKKKIRRRKRVSYPEAEDFDFYSLATLVED